MGSGDSQSCAVVMIGWEGRASVGMLRGQILTLVKCAALSSRTH